VPGSSLQFSYTVASGNLPWGLTLASAGVLSGTPTVNGTYTFTVQATSTSGLIATQVCTLTINPAKETARSTRDGSLYLLDSLGDLYHTSLLDLYQTVATGLQIVETGVREFGLDAGSNVFALGYNGTLYCNGSPVSMQGTVALSSGLTYFLDNTGSLYAMNMQGQWYLATEGVQSISYQNGGVNIVYVSSKPPSTPNPNPTPAPGPNPNQLYTYTYVVSAWVYGDPDYEVAQTTITFTSTAANSLVELNNLEAVWDSHLDGVAYDYIQHSLASPPVAVS